MFFFTILLSLSQVYAVTPQEFGKAVNIAGRQRMLSQKMAKEALFVKAGVNKDQNQKNLNATMDLFEKSLMGLEKGDASMGLPAPPNDKIAKQLGKVRGLWKEYQATLKSLDANKIAKQSPKVLKQMNSAVKMYEVASIKAGIKGKGKVINIAGRQRMLTQKMAKEILLVINGIDADGNRKQLKKTKTLFVSSLNALVSGDKKMRVPATEEPTIQKQLEKVKSLWAKYEKFVDEVIAGKNPNNEQLNKIQDINLKVLKEMNQAVGMYEKMS